MGYGGEGQKSISSCSCSDFRAADDGFMLKSNTIAVKAIHYLHSQKSPVHRAAAAMPDAFPTIAPSSA